ncbi:hypothetical protein K439DRAFT_1625393 [Ramaria rubella]|nr:hypothetical protein K439DRAFT_1625393 [Ramaria rubella]
MHTHLSPCCVAIENFWADGGVQPSCHDEKGDVVKWRSNVTSSPRTPIRMPQPSGTHHLQPKPWDKKLRIKFEGVPMNATDKSLWYGPWDTAIHRLFKDGKRFQIAPQHLRADHCGEPKWTIFYLIKTGMIPVCVVKIKPYCNLKRPQVRVRAYAQVEEHLKVLVIDDNPIPAMYGISIIGEHFLIMTIMTCTGMITPVINTHPTTDTAMTEITPAALWHNQVLKNSGYCHLMAMVRNIKEMCKPFLPAMTPEIALISEEEDSDTLSLSFEE